MPRPPRAAKRVPSLWLAITVWQMWRRLPAPVRRRIYQEARVQGPKVMKAAQQAVQQQLAKRK
jgi:hypothetical protein